VLLSLLRQVADGATHVAVATTILPVGDENGHILGVGRREGTATLSNGETAAYYNVGTFDIRPGKGGTAKDTPS
jgi:hypothetical protein